MSTEDKGQASGLEVELAVPVTGTEQTPQIEQQQTQVQSQEIEEDEDGQQRAGEDEAEKSARAERRRRSRERRQQREEQMMETIARQGEMLEQVFHVLPSLMGQAQGTQLAQAQGQYDRAKAQMAAAYESGKPDQVAEATEALTIARLNLDALKHRRPTRPQPQAPRQPQGQAEAQPNPYQQAWLSKNDWYTDPERKRDAAVAYAISQSLVDDGYPENDPEHFAELDRELKRRGIGVAQGNGHTPPKVIVASGQRQSLNAPKNKVVLSTRVQEHAAKFGLNLSDPKTRERIARRFAAQQTR